MMYLFHFITNRSRSWVEEPLFIEDIATPHYEKDFMFTKLQVDLHMLEFLLSAHTHHSAICDSVLSVAQARRGHESEWNLRLILAEETRVFDLPDVRHRNIRIAEAANYIETLQYAPKGVYPHFSSDHSVGVSAPGKMDKRNLVWFDAERKLIFTYNKNAGRRITESIEVMRKALFQKYSTFILGTESLPAGTFQTQLERIRSLYNSSPINWPDRLASAVV